jgi:hypothetical protein
MQYQGKTYTIVWPGDFTTKRYCKKNNICILWNGNEKRSNEHFVFCTVCRVRRRLRATKLSAPGARHALGGKLFVQTKLQRNVVLVALLGSGFERRLPCYPLTYFNNILPSFASKTHFEVVQKPPHFLGWRQQTVGVDDKQLVERSFIVEEGLRAVLPEHVHDLARCVFAREGERKDK